MFSTLKRIASTLLIVSMVLPLAGTALAASGTGYAISVTATSTAALTFSMSGLVSADPYKGTEAQQIIMVTDWGDGSSATAADTNLTFGSGKTFSGTWSVSHIYAAPGDYAITVSACHQSCNGGDEGKDFSSATINPFVGTPSVTTFTLSYTAGANGSLTGSSTQIVASGANGTAVTAVADANYHFVNWSDNSTANPRTDLNASSSLTLTANFAADVIVPTLYTFAYTAGANGTLTGSSTQIVASGANGTAVTAVANANYHFVNWSDLSTANPRTDTNASSSVTVTANFAADVTEGTTTHTLTYAAGANGSLTGDVFQTVNEGTSGTAVTAVPATGYHFVNWTDSSTDNPRTDTNVMADISVMANFEQDAPVVTGSIGGGNGVPGCKDPKATNYDSTAFYEGPCTYAPATGEVLGASASTLPTVGEVLGASTSTLSCSEYLALNAGLTKKALREGAKNDPALVVLLQKFLNDYVEAHLPTTGFFGPLTTAAVKKLQLSNKESILAPWKLSKATGIVYVTTIAHINNTKCPTLNLKVDEKDLVPAIR